MTSTTNASAESFLPAPEQKQEEHARADDGGYDRKHLERGDHS